MTNLDLNANQLESKIIQQEQEIQFLLKEVQRRGSVDKIVPLPIYYEQAFQKLRKKIDTANEEIKSLKAEKEAMLAFIEQHHNSPEQLGIYRQLVVKLQALTKENEELGQMLGLGRIQQLMTDVAIRKKEAQMLQDGIENYRKQNSILDTQCVELIKVVDLLRRKLEKYEEKFGPIAEKETKTDSPPEA
ncbi:hypothetical protein NEOLI_002523 [Neolecta irregularis DAH-3]|uniref:Uncharacterized protein n=1 Tax=Neolecta irregularis (strain DAH-3) TaxID=1198029 RepID=A0A1U7LUA7_NEOID|nr:hypothetical protein NEOLI_002523 [Neolecta irregularis DAH-3]|eukprot:OLL26101.1 hypothetical protein NEOLI_002523 [Neolecta irregularis DAH-3]